MTSPYGQVTGTERTSSRPHATPASAEDAAEQSDDEAVEAGAAAAARSPKDADDPTDTDHVDEAVTPMTAQATDLAPDPAADGAADGSTLATAVPLVREPVSASTPQEAAESVPTALGAGAAGIRDNTPVTAAAGASGAEAPRRRRRWPVMVGAAVLLLLGVVGAGGYAYAQHYAEVAVPGSHVAGIDVSGMSREEIVAVVQDRADEATVTISGDASTAASLPDLGVSVDAEATADAVLAEGHSVIDRFTALLGRTDTPVTVSSDSSTAQEYATALVPGDVAKATNATVVLNTEGTGFEITPASSGTSLDSSSLEAAAAQAASSLSDAQVEVSLESSPPAVSDEQAQSVADTANAWVAQDVTIAAAEDSTTYTADAATKASWVTVTTEVDTLPVVSLDTDKVAQWVAAQVEEVTVEPVTGVRNVNSQGSVVETSVEAVAGKSVTNADAIVQAITEAVSSETSYEGVFEVSTSEETWEEKVIADGAENLVYQAAPRERWIDINLSTKTVTAYEGATVVRGPVSIVDGDAQTPTVTGTYKVYLQRETQTMEGDNADGTRYRTENVPWISYFYEGYALHGAPWRSNFGYSGSHGCINMPVEEAQWIYSWAEVGTTVVSHY
ncbi:MAG: L,D-transpeptidase family protein [Actinomyces sp.]|uniref:L,D-transpeptidase n=1 Tax=Actinomyces sp. TaxID=29317 RepID=UPI0026DD6569|nr:L,D-transpeptidase family protein [Actinomyces sp.]MDO4244055.1 L,D-transpeptidase family protein [Actinomyces sp.]